MVGSIPPRSQHLPESEVTTKSSAYDLGFTQKLLDVSVYDNLFEYPGRRPESANLEELIGIMNEPLRMPSSGPISKQTQAQLLKKNNAAMSE